MSKNEIGNIPDRFAWALEIIDVNIAERILEIGCGAGVLATFMVDKLSVGKLTAVDKSLPMTSKAVKHLAPYIDAGRAEVVTKDFSSFNSKVPFDKIVAFNVNFFWKDRDVEFQVLKKLLHKDSSLLVFYDSPGKLKTTVINRIKENLLKHSFLILEVNFMKGEAVCCVQAVLPTA